MEIYLAELASFEAVLFTKISACPQLFVVYWKDKNAAVWEGGKDYGLVGVFEEEKAARACLRKNRRSQTEGVRHFIKKTSGSRLAKWVRRAS